jgi:hypothetical protein
MDLETRRGKMPYAVNDIVQTRFVNTQAEQAAYNILHVKVTAQVLAGATEQEIADNQSLAWGAFYRNAMVNSATYIGVGMKKISPGGPGFETVSKVNTGVGMVAGDMLPRQIAGLTTLVSTLAGRSGRGRMYIPFPGEASNDVNSTPTAGYLALLDAFCLAWKATYVIASIVNPGASTTIRYGIFSKVLGAINLAANAVCKDAWATQRRRGTFGRANLPPF